MQRKKALVFASGTESGGGSGFEKLVIASWAGTLNADIVGVVSNVANGGVRARAERLRVPFIHFPKPRDPEGYQRIAEESGADFFPLSGWTLLVVGLDLATRLSPRTVFNIHPGPLPKFGGKGFHGHRVHEAVMAAFRRGEITHSAVTMHFVDEEYDRGPVFFRRGVRINEHDTPDSLGTRVNAEEHLFQARITSMVINGKISWDGVDPSSLVVPQSYQIETYA